MSAFFTFVVGSFRSRATLQLETVALRHQLGVLNRSVQFPVMFKTVRRARVRKFPYSLFLTMADEAVVVVACVHASRDPKRWRERV